MPTFKNQKQYSEREKTVFWPPKKYFVINNESMTAFLKHQSEWTEPETPAYDIYPSGLKEPYRTSRYELGEQMYNLLNISREDKEARFMQVLKNF